MDAHEEAIVPAPSAEAQALKTRARAFTREHLHPFEADIAAHGHIDRDHLEDLRARARATGFSNVNLPAAHGGHDPSMVDLVAIEEEAGWSTNGLGYLVADRGPRELLEVATPDQVERYVGPVVRRDYREAWAITEPGAGSDVAGITTTAVRDGDDWLLSGEKWFVTDGDHAGVFAVLARADGEETVFLVPADAPGLRVTATPTYMHDPYISRHVDLVLEDCRVPERDRVPDGGGDSARVWFSVERLMIAARCCGTAERILGIARDWAQERIAFGNPIASYQGVSFPLADSLVELSAARLLTYHAAASVDAGDDPKIVHARIAAAKLYASEMAGRVADRALQILGGRGYRRSHPVERYYRELRVDRIWEGTSEIQREIIARGLFKRGVTPHLP
jgi:acyl-CoA dehydrogenase